MSLADEFEKDFMSDEDDSLEVIKEEDEDAIDDMLLDEDDTQDGIQRSMQ